MGRGRRSNLFHLKKITMAKTALVKIDSKGNLTAKLVEGDYMKEANKTPGDYIALPVITVSKPVKEEKPQ